MNNTIPQNNSAQINNPITDEQIESLPFNSLSPINDADKDGHYSSMLLWALKHRREKDIKNIALTGPYGSGKSSVLKTFENKYTSDDLVFLNISLATFKEEKENEASKLKTNKKVVTSENNINGNTDSSPAEKQAMLRLVELSILQQIFYHEKDEVIPDTRFKKTRSFSEESAYQLTWGIFLFVVSLLYLLYSTKFWNIFHITPNKCVNIFFHILALGTILYLGFSFIKGSIRPLRNIQLKKFNLQDAEFAMDETISKSILNEHLDEILYFFEVTKYTVVVFEDLDRFEQTEIFTKLRELNHLINYSNKINRRVVFIYAVRDDMFRDKDRTKFFDFIIPIIPVVDFSNSYERLLTIKNENSYNISTYLLEDVSYYIDDMRLLYNIMNEFHLYFKKQGQLEQLNPNKLFAMVVYKNIYPNDFVKLSCKEGELYSIIAKKADYIKLEEDSIDKQIEDLDKKIQDIRNNKYPTVKALRETYIMEILRGIGNFQTIVVNGTETSIGGLSENQAFEAIMQDNASYFPLTQVGDHNPNQFTRSRNTTKIIFNDIENRVDTKQTYKKKEELVNALAEGQIDILLKDRKGLEREKERAKHLTLKQLVKDHKIESEIKNEKQRRLIATLIRAGYIDENYSDFISIFYPGSISLNDRKFLMSLRSGEYTDFDFPLENIENLILKIRENEFEQPYILNYSLFDHIFSKRGANTDRSKIIKSLSDESEKSIEFIDGFISSGKHLETFLPLLAKQWPRIWDYIGSRSFFAEERIQTYFKLFIEYLDLEDLKLLEKESDLASYIEDSEHFLTIIKNEKKLKKIIETFNIKFENLALENAPSKLVDFVFEKLHYQLNYTMVRRWIQLKGEYSKKEFETQNYTHINEQADNLISLIHYIDDNLALYLENIWFVQDGPITEDPSYLQFIINQSVIPIETKEQILEQNISPFPNLKEIYGLELKQLILEKNRIKPTWSNLLNYFAENEKVFDAILINYINNVENAKTLISQDLEAGEDDDEKKLTNNFSRSLMLCSDISDDYYSKLIDKMPYHHIDLDFTQLNEKKVERLVNNLSIEKANYDRLREKFSPLHINLLERSPKSIIEKPTDFEIDTEDVIKILRSTKFNVVEKNKILHTLSEEEIIADKSLINIIGVIASVNDGITISRELLTVILKSDLSILNKIPLYNKYQSLYAKDEFFELMQYFGKDFKDIIPNGKQTVIPDSQQNWTFARLIYVKGYTHEPKPDKRGIRIRNVKA